MVMVAQDNTFFYVITKQSEFRSYYKEIFFCITDDKLEIPEIV